MAKPDNNEYKKRCAADLIRFQKINFFLIFIKGHLYLLGVKRNNLNSKDPEHVCISIFISEVSSFNRFPDHMPVDMKRSSLFVIMPQSNLHSSSFLQNSTNKQNDTLQYRQKRFN